MQCQNKAVRSTQGQNKAVRSTQGGGGVSPSSIDFWQYKVEVEEV